jgi:hypothetical protein
MVNKPLSRELHGEPPPLDESWWTALLAEEEKPHHRLPNLSPADQKDLA